MSTNKCFICKNTPTSAHHIIPRAEGGTDDERNIIYVCEKCHNIIEGKNWNETMAFKKEFLEDQQLLSMIPKNRSILLKDKRLIELDKNRKEWRIWEKIPGGLKSTVISKKEVISHLKAIAEEFQTLTKQIMENGNQGQNQLP